MGPVIVINRPVWCFLLFYAVLINVIRGQNSEGKLENNVNIIRTVSKSDFVNGSKPDQVLDPYGSFVEDVTKDVLAKRFVGNDTVLAKTRRQPKVPSYVWMLYNAIEEEQRQGDSNHVTTGHMPIIRAIKSEARRGHLEFILRSHYKNVERVEMVLKVSDNPQWLENNEDNLTISIISSENDRMPFHGQRHRDYLIFDISQLRDDLKRVLVMKRSFLSDDQEIRISARFEPILVIFEFQRENPLLRGDLRVKRDLEGVENEGGGGGASGSAVGGVAVGGGGEGAGNGAVVEHEGGNLPAHMSYLQSTEAPQQIQQPSYHCKRYNWTIDMRIFNWNWFAYPIIMELGFCSGSCPFPLDANMLNSTNYSFLKNRWHVENHGMDDSVPGECCTPVSYLPASIIYVSSSHDFVMRSLPNMRVVSCGCR